MNRIKSFFSFRRVALIGCGLLGAIIGYLIYGAAVRQTYESLRDSIQAAAPLAPLLAQDPSVGVSPHCHGDETPVRAAHAYRALQLASLLPGDAEFEQVPEAVQRALGVSGGEEAVDVCERGIPLLVRLAQAAGRESNSAASAAEVREDTEDYIAWVLTGEPGAIAAYEETVDRNLAGEAVEGGLEPSAYGDPGREKVSLSESQDEVLRILFEQTGAHETFADFVGGDTDRAQEREVVIGFARALVLGIDRDPSVSHHRLAVQIVQGPEQFCMLILFAVVMLLVWVQLYFRGVREPIQDDDDEHLLLVLHRERWFIRWMIGAIPSIGFIGTIRGLSDALGKADLIVSVSTRAEQATAIGDVSTTLALAFTTTLVALVLALIAGFFSEMTESVEQAMALRKDKPRSEPPQSQERPSEPSEESVEAAE